MANRDIASIDVPATSQDLMTLDECKTLLNVSAADTSRDAQLQMQISIASAICADIVFRRYDDEPTGIGFGMQTLHEEWREIGNGRLFLLQWPVKQIIDLTVGGTLLASGDYRLEKRSGKVSVDGQWGEPAIVHYTAGYQLPEGAPLALKQACMVMVQEQRIRNQQAQTAGIRLLSHKESRVAFFDPNAILLKSISAKSPGMQAAEALLLPWMRLEV